MVYTAGFNMEVLECEDDLPLIRVVNVLIVDIICDHTALDLGPALALPHHAQGSIPILPLTKISTLPLAVARSCAA